MAATATLENAAAQAGDLGSGGGAIHLTTAASIAWPAPCVKPRPVYPWYNKTLANLVDCAQAILEGPAPLRPWERWVLTAIRRRLLRAAGRMNP